MVVWGWLLAVASVAAAALVVVRRRPGPLDTAVLLLGGLGVAIWNVTGGFYLVGPLTPPTGALFLVGISLAVTTWLVLARRLAYPEWRPASTVLVLLAVEPTLLALSTLLPADTWGELFWPPEPWREEPFGLGYQIHSPYCIVLIAVGAAALLRRTEQTTGLDRILALGAVVSVSLGVGALIAGVRSLPITGFVALLLLLVAFDRTHTGAAGVAAAAERDPVTDALGRRGLDLVLAHAVEFADRRRTPLSVMVIDIDDFKGVNDTHGHIVGDLALRRVVDRARAATGGLVGRFGGDEFVVVLLGTALAEAVEHAQLLARVVAEPFDAAGSPAALTVSVGVAEYAGGPAEDLLAAADEAMYVAKRHGGGGVSTASAQPTG
ncbi:diguanylate cyclase [Nocardioides sp.]|uniref:GGDEF domain-containing protein n=1 Tax=Nocardioides sp. TaxID=35761 RepID=UPI0039E2CDC5